MPTAPIRHLNGRRPARVVAPCERPAASRVDRGWAAAADYQDAYCVALHQPELSVSDIFFAVLGHRPWWMSAVLLARNRLASLIGLAAPTATEILNPQIKDHYEVGDKIGPWPLFHMSSTELIAGRDNRHLDFRLSVMKAEGDGRTWAVVSTICATHNTFGKLYLRAVLPFHRWGVQRLMLDALQSGRL